MIKLGVAKFNIVCQKKKITSKFLNLIVHIVIILMVSRFVKIKRIYCVDIENFKRYIKFKIKYKNCSMLINYLTL